MEVKWYCLEPSRTVFAHWHGFGATEMLMEEYRSRMEFIKDDVAEGKVR